MKNKNEVTGNLILGCTVLRILVLVTPEFPGAVTTLLLEHAVGMPGYRSLHDTFAPLDVCTDRLGNVLAGRVQPVLKSSERPRHHAMKFDLDL